MKPSFIVSYMIRTTAMRRLGTCVMFLVVATFGSTGVARATPTYQYVFERNVYQVAPGGTIDVHVLLQETVGTGDISVLAPGGVGLFGAGVKVVFGDAPQPSDPARVRYDSDISASSAFDVVTPAVETIDAKLSLFALDNPAVYGQEYSLGVYRLELGTFRFTAGTVGGESTPLRATDYDPVFDDVITSDLRALDGSPIYDGMATITTSVPEPGTMALLGSGFLVSAFLWLRRRIV
jgi:hypothetical protein